MPLIAYEYFLREEEKYFCGEFIQQKREILNCRRADVDVVLKQAPINRLMSIQVYEFHT